MACAQQSNAQDETGHTASILSDLKAGGYILVMRHANSPYDQQASVGMTDGCILAEGRGLDATGYFQARALGEYLRAEGVPLLKSYTSDMCRSYDTASIVSAGAPVIPHPSQKTEDPAIIAQFKKEIEAELAANHRSEYRSCPTIRI